MATAIGSSGKVLITSPADSKTEFMKFDENSPVGLAKRVVKGETLDRITKDELVNRFFCKSITLPRFIRCQI